MPPTIATALTAIAILIGLSFAWKLLKFTVKVVVVVGVVALALGAVYQAGLLPEGLLPMTNVGAVGHHHHAPH